MPEVWYDLEADIKISYYNKTRYEVHKLLTRQTHNMFASERLKETKLSRSNLD